MDEWKEMDYGRKKEGGDLEWNGDQLGDLWRRQHSPWALDGAGKARSACGQAILPLAGILQRAHRQRQRQDGIAHQQGAGAWLVSAARCAPPWSGLKQVSADSGGRWAPRRCPAWARSAPSTAGLPRSQGQWVGLALDGQVDAIDGLASAGVQRVSLVSSSRAVVGGHGVGLGVHRLCCFNSDSCLRLLALIAVMTFHLKSKHPARHRPRPVASAS